MITKQIFGWMMLTVLATAQQTLQTPPFQTEDDRAALRGQAGEMFDVLSPITQEAGKSAVWIWFKSKKLLSIGTVVGEGDRVLTKWSEIAKYKDQALQCVTGTNDAIPATVIAVYEDEDIAVLQLKNKRLKPVVWAVDAKPQLGTFLVAAGPGDSPLNLGVVSVNERSLRASDQAFAGVLVKPTKENNGVEVEQVVEKSPVAKAGMLAGDVIRQLDGAAIKGPMEFRSALTRMSPQQRVKFLVLRKGEEITLDVTLEQKSEGSQSLLRQNQVMERMGGDISEVRDGFPAVIQSDLVLNPEECGAPVFDLEGRAVGLAIARSGRVRSYVISASQLSQMMKKPGVEPAVAKVRKAERGPELARNRAVMPRLNREQMQSMRARALELKRFMGELDEEILELDR
jgi:S1-C subfamily serine protease